MIIISNVFRFSIIIAIFLIAPTAKAIAQDGTFTLTNSILAFAYSVKPLNNEDNKYKLKSYIKTASTDKSTLKNETIAINITDTTISEHSSAVLPMNLTGFRTITAHNNIFLQWNASYLQHVQQLMVEQSADGISFQEVSDVKVNPAEKTNGIILSQDDGVFYYRLKIIDSNGAKGYTETLACKTDTKGSGIVSVFPNAVSDEWLTALHIATAYRGKIKVVITDDHGKQLLEFHREIISEKTRISIGVTAIPKGVYSIFVSQSDGSHIGMSQELVKL